MLRFLPQAMAAGQKASIALLALSAMLLLAPIHAAERRAEQSPPALIVDAAQQPPVQPRRSPLHGRRPFRAQARLRNGHYVPESIRSNIRKSCNS
jgi:hypothetical protein